MPEIGLLPATQSFNKEDVTKTLETIDSEGDGVLDQSTGAFIKDIFGWWQPHIAPGSKLILLNQAPYLSVDSKGK